MSGRSLRRAAAFFACAALVAATAGPVGAQRINRERSPIERTIERAREIVRAAREAGIVELPELEELAYREVIGALDLDDVVPFAAAWDEQASSPRRRGRAQSRRTTGSFAFRVERPVAQFVTYFARGAGRKSFETGLRRSGLYRDIAEQVFREEGVPTDLVWLAQVESLWKPWALSSASAKGLWQFIPSTGRRFGLDRTHWTDERADPYASTRAAARYLRTLNRRFKGDWLLALAAYNAGEGAVGRAVARGGRADFWHLYRRGLLPRETRNYVPAILATITIARDPARYGIGTRAAPAWRYDTVAVAEQTNLRTVADLTHASLDEVWQHNPELRRGVTPPGRYSLRIPRGSRDRFLAAYSRPSRR